MILAWRGKTLSNRQRWTSGSRSAQQSEDDQAVVGVRRLPQGREDNPACGDPGEDEGLDPLRAQDHLKVASGKGAYPAFRDDDVALPWGQRRMNLRVRIPCVKDY